MIVFSKEERTCDRLILARLLHIDISRICLCKGLKLKNKEAEHLLQSLTVFRLDDFQAGFFCLHLSCNAQSAEIRKHFVNGIESAGDYR